MEVTQGVLKGCNVYSVLFDNKYSNIKTILTTNDQSSKFLATDVGSISQTSTILSSNNMYYNIVEDCNTYYCNIKNGKFINSFLFGISGVTYIDDGYFSGCTLSGYTINGGNFYNCNIGPSNTWKTGQLDNISGSTTFSPTWNGGVWNSGTFTGDWSGGTFNGGTFIGKNWYDGVANGGTFDGGPSGTTWHNGIVRNAEFIDCKFLDGVFNNGTFSGGTFSGGTFNNGRMTNTSISGGTFYGGTISGVTIRGTNTEFKGGNVTDTKIYDGKFFNINGTNLKVSDGEFYSGNYNNTHFTGGTIYNGLYLNVSGETSGVTIHNGSFKDSNFDRTNISNGNFTNCNSTNLKWKYGIYTEGTMTFNLPGSYWRGGYWNDGAFIAVLPQTGVTSNPITVGAPPTTTTTTTFLGTTTTTTTTSIPMTYVIINSNNIPYGSDLVITGVKIDGLDIVGASFPLKPGYYTQGTTTKIGYFEIEVVYTTYMSDQNILIVDSNLYPYCKDVSVGSPFTHFIDVNAGQNITIKTSWGSCS